MRSPSAFESGSISRPSCSRAVATSDPLHGLERRLALLERERSLWRIGACAAALLLIGARTTRALEPPAATPAATEAGSPALVAGNGPVRIGELHVRSITLEAPDGTTRATLAVLPDHTLGLVMLDAKGTPRVSLGVAPDGAPALKLVGSDKGYAALAVGNDGASVLGLRSAKGKSELAALPDGTLGLTLNDASGNPRATLAAKESGVTAALLDHGGNGGVLLAAPAKGTPALELRGHDGKALFRRP